MVTRVIGEHLEFGQTLAEYVKSVTLDGTDPDSLAFEVHNEGSIPEAVLPELFSPFRGALEWVALPCTCTFTSTRPRLPRLIVSRVPS